MAGQTIALCGLIVFTPQSEMIPRPVLQSCATAQDTRLSLHKDWCPCRGVVWEDTLAIKEKERLNLF